MRSADGRFRYVDFDGEFLPAGSPPEAVQQVEFRCRSHDMMWCSVWLRGRGHDRPNRSWNWDGNVAEPTLSPSINCQNDKCWHGYIEAGVFNKTDHTPEAKQ